MKITFRSWEDWPISGGNEKWILKVPYRDLPELALELVQCGSLDNLIGLVPPSEPNNLAYTFSCIANVTAHFNGHRIYCPVAMWTPREFIRSCQSANHRAFLLPWQGEAMTAKIHQVHDLLEDCAVHVAGGEVEREGWTWSEEGLT